MPSSTCYWGATHGSAGRCFTCPPPRRCWWRHAPGRDTAAPARDQRTLCWAGAVPVLLLASFYAPVYDATLLVLSGFLVAGVVYRNGRPELIRSFEAMVLLVYLGAIVSQPLARVLHVQVLTIILALSAVYVFFAARVVGGLPRRTEASASEA